jgi:hypothetical protein
MREFRNYLEIMMNKKALPPLSPMAKSLVIGGLYEHYKGNQYKVLSVARHSETLEELVVYQALYGEKGVWVRPLAMFLEDVNINGQLQPRFKSLKKNTGYGIQNAE